MTSITELLYKPFDNIDSRQGRGGTYDYVKWQNVADRMNEVFGIHWTSRIESQEIIGDKVIVRVSVCVLDEESKMQFSHEGYGGSVMRDSDEPGSAHKAAYSKALKDACKKWGLALHLDAEEPSQPQTKAPISMPPGFTGYETAQPTTTTYAVPSTVNDKVAMMVPPANPLAPATEGGWFIKEAPEASIAPVETTIAPPQRPTFAQPTTTIPVNREMGLPSIPSPTGVNQVAQQSMPPAPPAPAPVIPANDGTLDANTPGSITNVQEMAIKNLSRLNGVEGQNANQFIQELINNPNCELKRQVNTLNELSYNEAVCVIKAAKNL